MSSKFEQMIDDMEEYIQNCKMKPLSNTMIIVNKDEILDMLQELRQKTPVEVSRYQKVISNKEAILNDARQKANEMLNEAAIHTNELVSETEVMQQAYAQAQKIVDMASEQAEDIVNKASEEAAAMRMAAISYTDDNLGSIENILSHGLDVAAANYERLMTQLQESITTVQANRAQLYPLDESGEDAGDEMEYEDDLADAQDGNVAQDGELGLI